MKRQLLNKIIFILILFPIQLFAQSSLPAEEDITGLWKGSLYNDTTKKNLPYQIAISEEDGKLSGYSYTLFDIDGKKEMGVKRVKIKRKNDQLIIEDVELISNNYSEPPPRKVRLQSIVNLSVNDTAMLLTGKWSTNQTREYRQLTGSLQLQRTIDYKALILFKILATLKLDNELSFVKAGIKIIPGIAIAEKAVTEIKPPIAVSAPPENGISAMEATAIAMEKKEAPPVENKPAADAIPLPEAQAIKNIAVIPAVIAAPLPLKKTGMAIAANESIKKENIPLAQSRLNLHVADKPAIAIAPLTEKKKDVIIAVNDSKQATSQPAAIKPKTIPPPAVINKTVAVAILKEPVKKENKPSPEIAKKPVKNDNANAITAPAIINKTVPVIAVARETVKTEIKPAVVVIIAPEPKKELPAAIAAPTVAAAAANVAERKMKNEQAVFFESDSLVLTLYDNGEVDGDTVSVLMNGQIIFAKQGLTTKANSKTIYIDKGMHDSLYMVMYAENLGSIPPNTGLLIIMDGEKRYEVRFSADLQTNSAILFRRKPKEK